MPGDLEEFLKRAAERRAAKQQQGGGGAAGQGRGGQGRGGQAAPRRRPRPEYTDAKRERQIREPVEDEPIPVAELVESLNPLAEQQRQVAEAKRRAEEARRRLEEEQEKLGIDEEGEPSAPRQQHAAPTGTPIQQLFQMLQRPEGVQQAFLLKEIMDRPTDRW
jgi:hypothetical protein